MKVTQATIIFFKIKKTKQKALAQKLRHEPNRGFRELFSAACVLKLDSLVDHQFL